MHGLDVFAKYSYKEIIFGDVLFLFCSDSKENEYKTKFCQRPASRVVPERRDVWEEWNKQLEDKSWLQADGVSSVFQSVCPPMCVCVCVFAQVCAWVCTHMIDLLVQTRGWQWVSLPLPSCAGIKGVRCHMQPLHVGAGDQSSGLHACVSVGFLTHWAIFPVRPARAPPPPIDYFKCYFFASLYLVCSVWPWIFVMYACQVVAELLTILWRLMVGKNTEKEETESRCASCIRKSDTSQRPSKPSGLFLWSPGRANASFLLVEGFGSADAHHVHFLHESFLSP